MTEPTRKVMVTVIALLPSALFLGLVWSICSAQADGIEVDWAFTRWLFVVLGIAAFGATIALTSLLIVPTSDEEDEPELEDEPVVKTTIVVMTPIEKPQQRTSITPVVIAAALAGAAGGLLAHLLMTRRDKR